MGGRHHKLKDIIIRNKGHQGKQIFYAYIKIGYPQTYQPLHRYLMEQKLNRKLKSSELIHHKNGKTLDNKLSNLQLTSRAEHMGKLHRKKRKYEKYFIKQTCKWCKKEFIKHVYEKPTQCCGNSCANRLRYFFNPSSTKRKRNSLGQFAKI